MVRVEFIGAGNVALLVMIFVAGINKNDNVPLEAGIMKKLDHPGAVRQLQPLFLHLRRKKLGRRKSLRICARGSRRCGIGGGPHRMGGSRRKIVTRQCQTPRRDLAGGECKGSPDRGHEHSFAQNPSKRHQAGGNCGLCQIIFHMNLATSVDESAPVRQSLFHQPHRGGADSCEFDSCRRPPSAKPSPEGRFSRTMIIKLNDVVKIQHVLH